MTEKSYLLRNRSEFIITDTELIAIANAAIIGFKNPSVLKMGLIMFGTSKFVKYEKKK
jgi:hypothetical protein